VTRAETIARSIPLRRIAAPDAVVRTLYGYTAWVLDEEAARREIERHGLRGDDYDEAMMVLDDRVGSLDRS